MAEKKNTASELSYEQEVEQFLNMDPEERNRQFEREMAERIVSLRRKARAERAAREDASD
jgi:hypothetical protein